MQTYASDGAMPCHTWPAGLYSDLIAGECEDAHWAIARRGLHSPFARDLAGDAILLVAGEYNDDSSGDCGEPFCELPPATPRDHELVGS